MKQFLAIFSILFSYQVWADEVKFLKGEQEIQSFAESVMEVAGADDFGGALLALKPHFNIPEAEFQGLLYQSQGQRNQFRERYGKSKGWEFVGKQTAGKSLIRLTFIELTEHHALPWDFYFYKRDGGWVLNSFVWHDQFPTLFQ